jgi:hypothetical protein
MFAAAGADRQIKIWKYKEPLYKDEDDNIDDYLQVADG